MDVVELAVVDPGSPSALRTMTEYFAELDRRFPDGFDPGDTLVADAAALRPPGGVFVVARASGSDVACGGVQRHDAHTGEIKRMWVHPDRRRSGLGRRLLSRLHDEAVNLGYRRVVLDTNPALVEAIALYEAAGYRSVERYNDNPYAGRWYARDLGPPTTA